MVKNGEQKLREWTLERIREHDNTGVTNLRNNALARGDEVVAARCDEVLFERKAIKKKPKRHIVELHYICSDGLNLVDLGDGTFRSGNWVLAKEHCNPVAVNGAILALYKSKKDKSFFQGKIIDWEPAPEESGLHRAKFVVQPTSEQLEWVGEATGERGYKWSDD